MHALTTSHRAVHQARVDRTITRRPAPEAGLALWRTAAGARLGGPLVAVVLKAALLTAAGFGLAPSLAAQPALVASQPSPASFTVGQAIAPITFGVSQLASAGSWRVTGTLPPGLRLTAREKTGVELGPDGGLDATDAPEYDAYGYTYTAGIMTTTPVLTGTPTQPGTFTLTFQAFPLGGMGGNATPGFSYAIAVAAAASGDPVPNPPPSPVAMVRQPAAAVVAPGSTVVLAGEAAGAATYQWRKDGTTLAGATGASLMLRGVTAADAGSYAVVAGNGTGSVTSSAATLTLSNDANFGHLVNLSIRTNLTAASPAFTLGTAIGAGGGGSAKPLLVRAVGPTLAGFGIATALADPKLDVFSGTNVIASNDDWAGGSALTGVFAQVGAFPLASASSKDAAIFNPGLAAGSYTVQVGGADGATGEILAELYDAGAAGSFSAAAPRLVNVSVRKQIDIGGTLTAGFVIGGATARTVLIRAIGPGLGAFGLTGFMPDPQLALFSGSARVAGNDNWAGDAQVLAAGTSVGAFPIANPASRDAMLVVTLSPGGYTVEVSGVGDSAGETLVEIYEVP